METIAKFDKNKVFFSELVLYCHEATRTLHLCLRAVSFCEWCVLNLLNFIYLILIP